MQTRLSYRLATVGALFIFFALGVRTITQKNPTADEPVHLTRGITLWQTGDFRFQQEHTPLSHWLIGTQSLAFANIPPVDSLPGWATGERLPAADALVWQSNLNVERLFFSGRLPILLLTGLMIAGSIAWSSRLAGRRAGLAAAGLLAFEPNLLAHGTLATTDAAAAAGFLFALLALWQYTRRPSPASLIPAGVALGVGIAAKMTGALLVPIFLVVLLANKNDRFSISVAQIFAALLLIAGAVVWTVYRFTWGPVSLPALTSPLTLPGPAYWDSLLGVNSHISGGHAAFFWGTIQNEGWWLYFPAAFLLKTPLITLLLSGGAIWWTARRGLWRATMLLWLPAALLFTFAILSRLNIGYRHILPVIPLLIVWAAAAVAPALRSNRKAAALMVAGLAMYAAFQLWIHPHHLAFFNPLAGGPGGGSRFLGDSNLDWGQDWQTAGRIIVAEQPQNPVVLPFGFIDLGYYGLANYSIVNANGEIRSWFAPANPAPGTYFLSVNALQGLLAEPDLLDYFRRLEPVNKRATGYSIYRFEISAAKSGAWIAHCAPPGVHLREPAAEQTVGSGALRHVYFDCARSWVFPEKGAAGWFVLPQNQPLPDPWLTEQAGRALVRVYTHRATTAVPAFDIYYWNGSALPAAWFPDQAETENQRLVRPLGGGRLLSGRWAAGWEVIEPTEIPLSFFGHLYLDGVGPVAIDDGLGFEPSQWRTGDIFIQFHAFEENPTGSDAAFQTGPYNFIDGERVSPPVEYEAEQVKR